MLSPMCPHPMQHRRSRGFTLVELLVVIAIIGILVALLLPAVQSAREAARRTQCLNNLRQMSLGLLNYESTYGAFPKAFEYEEGVNPGNMSLRQVGSNWAVLSLPFMEQQPLFDQFDFTLPIGNSANEPARATPIDIFSCPSDFYNTASFVQGTIPVRRIEWARGNYAANAGNGPLLTSPVVKRSLFPDGINIYGPNSPGWRDGRIRGCIGPNVAAKLSQVTDGTSNTILVAEVRAGLHAEDQRGIWALGQAGSSVLFWFGSGGDANGPNACNDFADDVAGCRLSDADLNKQECMTCWHGDDWNNQATTRSTHVGGVSVGMADGSSHFISDDIETSGVNGPWGTVWDKLIASADGEIIAESPY